MDPVPDETSVLIEGPWTHRQLNANGIRFHVAELGSGPLVLLLHGFPQFWWMWRHQMSALAAAGFRVVAPDLRGYGASDKPPRGYDLYTTSSDIGGMIRALGEQRAVVVGHDWGGLLAWVTAILHPRVVRRLVVLDMPHPLRMGAALTRSGSQLAASGYVLAFQTPKRPESQLQDEDGAFVGRLLRQWSGPDWPTHPDFNEADWRYRQQMRIPGVANCSLEYYRWVIRSLTRPTGWSMARLLRRPVTCPTLQLHGALDHCLLPETAMGSGKYVSGEYEWRQFPDVGHFLPEEAPEAVNSDLIRWARAG